MAYKEFFVRNPGVVASIYVRYSVVTCFSSPLVPFKNSLTTPPGAVIFIWITLQFCFALGAPRWRFRLLCAHPPRLCGMYLGVAYSFDLLKVPPLVF